MPDDPRSASIERAQQAKFRFSWRPPELDHDGAGARDYFAKLGALRLDVIRRHYRGGTVLDVGCGPGDYLLGVGRFAEHVVGVDFSPELLAIARERLAAEGRSNSSLGLANARALPLMDRSVRMVFSLATLYTIPRVGEVVDECARVLEDGGLAILEFGNLTSLNTIVSRAAPGAPPPCHLTLTQMSRLLMRAGLTVLEWRAFQVLPLYSQRPWYLRPLLHPWWKRVMGWDVRGRMVDEWLSSSPVLRPVAFRHLVVARRVRAPDGS